MSVYTAFSVLLGLIEKSKLNRVTSFSLSLILEPRLQIYWFANEVQTITFISGKRSPLQSNKPDNSPQSEFLRGNFFINERIETYF